MNPLFLYKTRYGQSHAVIVGIDEYMHAGPLQHAVNDAKAVAAALVDTLLFPKDNVTVLLGTQATRAAILSVMWALADKTSFDDRVVFFFAGHGATREARSGDMGFLVPVDGNPSDPSTLIRWQELVGTTGLIQAKHILFLMDACYSGLAIVRAPTPSATRMVGDLLRRRAIQVITAGKADQPVADAGGPRAGHSAFTGHLLDGLEGGATRESGVLTAVGLMAYVYQKVIMQEGAVQTPHYGSMDGDGDMILILPPADAEQDESGDEPGARRDLFISLPSVDQDIIPRDALAQKVERTKVLLASDAGSIELHDLMMGEVRAFLAATPDADFPLQGHATEEQVADRIARYDQASTRLCVAAACVAYWGSPAHRQSLLKSFARTSDRIGSASGSGTYLALRWLPTLTVFYACGVAAVNAGRYATLAAMFSMRMPGDSYERRAGDTLVGLMSDAVLGLYNGVAATVMWPEHASARVSNYMFATLQARLDDALFLGKDYEAAFDRFEMLAHVAAIDAALVAGNAGPYGFPGRYDVRNDFFSRTTKFADFIKEARRNVSEWPPLRAGMFGGDHVRLTAALNYAAPSN